MRHLLWYTVITIIFSVAAAASANAAAAQMIDPNNGYAFVDPTYAALAMQVRV